MGRFKAYFFIFFCVIISMIFSGCGTIKGVGNDISIIGEILKKV